VLDVAALRRQSRVQRAPTVSRRRRRATSFASPTAPSATQSASQRVALHADLAASPIERAARRGARRAARQRWLVGHDEHSFSPLESRFASRRATRALLRLRNAFDEACRWH